MILIRWLMIKLQCVVEHQTISKCNTMLKERLNKLIESWQ